MTALTFGHGFTDLSLAASVGASWHACLDVLVALADGREAASDGAELRRVYDAWFAGEGAKGADAG